MYVVKGKVVPVLNQVLRHEELPISLLSSTLWRRIGSEGIASRILSLGAKWRWVASFIPWPLYPLYPLCRRLGWRQSSLLVWVCIITQDKLHHWDGFAEGDFSCHAQSISHCMIRTVIHSKGLWHHLYQCHVGKCPSAEAYFIQHMHLFTSIKKEFIIKGVWLKELSN
jgi:hypothetical protein